MAYNPSEPSQYDTVIEQAAKLNNLPVDLFRKQLWQESKFKPDAVSKAGAKGIGQFIPSTGKAYGLKTDADFFDPIKSINASAKYMKDLMESYGDWNTALVAYNGGPKAAKNYKAGNFDALPAETQHYVSFLGSDTPISRPKLKLNDFDQRPEFNVTRKNVFDTVSQPVRFQENFESIIPKEGGVAQDVGFLGGLTHGATGTYVRQLLSDSDPFDTGSDYVPNDQERRTILEAVGWDKTAYDATVRGIKSPEDIKGRIDITLGNIEYERESAKAGIVSSFMSGLGDAVTDPLNYASAAATGGLGTIGRVVIGGGVGNVLSGQLRERVTGVESDMMVDMVDGATFGAAFDGTARALGGTAKYLGDSSRRADIIREHMKNGTTPDPKILEGYGGSNGMAARINQMRDFAESKLPKWTVGETMATAKNPAIRELHNKLFRRERGTFTEDAEGNRVLTEIGKSPTVFELVGRQDQELFNINTVYTEGYDKLLKLGYTEADIELAVIRKLTNKVTNISDPILDEIVSPIAASIKDRGEQLVARGIIDGTVEDYGLPLSIDQTKVSDFIQIFGGGRVGQEKAIESIQKALIGRHFSGKGRVKLMKFYEKYHMPKPKKGETFSPTQKDTMFDEWLEDQAYKSALGYVDQGKSTSGNMFNGRDFSSKYDNHRIPWDTSVDIVTPSGKIPFDSLRDNVWDTFSRYHRRTAGDIAFSDTLGYKGYSDVLDNVGKMMADEELIDPKATSVSRATKQAIKMAYGMSPKEDARGLNSMNAIADTLRNIAFFTKNGYMGLMNHTETTEGVKAYGGAFIIKSLPGASKLLGNWTKGKMSDADVRAIQNTIFGEEVRKLNIWRDIKRNNIDRYGGNKFAASIVSGTEYIANASPMTKYLQASHASIVREAQGQFLGELARAAHGLRKTKKGFFNKVDLDRNSLSTEDAQAMLDAVRKATKVDSKGGIEIVDSDALFNDPVVLGNLRRMGDYVADNVIQRRNPADAFLWQDGNNPMLDLIMQFKTFAIRSYNKRLAKMMNRVEDEGYMSQVLTLGISGALATAGFVGTTALRAQGLSDEDREKFLERNLGVSTLSEAMTLDGLAEVAYNGGIKRNGILAYPTLALNMLGIGNTSGKTTFSTSYGNESDASSVFKVGDFLMNMFPAAGTAESSVNLGINAYDLLREQLGIAEYTEEEQERIQKRFYRNLKQMTPNWPVLQNYGLELLKGDN